MLSQLEKPLIPQPQQFKLDIDSEQAHCIHIDINILLFSDNQIDQIGHMNQYILQKQQLFQFCKIEKFSMNVQILVHLNKVTQKFVVEQQKKMYNPQK
ncbi:unnamed protein product [Paramecium primaurelia]|uniref:Uncharacterized protein n=1 Tax=Paramecium primaurelia TaxID=5886 RepID=A0A8S1K0U7_PARPR|nr:unnamed protein product [Paramecium primaurelia]